MNRYTKAETDSENSDEPQPGCSHYREEEEQIADSSDGSTVTRRESSGRLSVSSSLRVHTVTPPETDVILKTAIPFADIPSSSFGSPERASRTLNWAQSLRKLEFYQDDVTSELAFENSCLSSSKSPLHISEASSDSLVSTIYSWRGLDGQLTRKRTSVDNGDVEPSDDLKKRCDILLENADSNKFEGELKDNTGYLECYCPYKRQKLSVDSPIHKRYPKLYPNVQTNLKNTIPKSLSELPDGETVGNCDIYSTNERTARETSLAERSVSLLPISTEDGAQAQSSDVDIQQHNSSQEVNTEDSYPSEQFSAESVIPPRPLREIQLSELTDNSYRAEAEQDDEEDDLADGDFNEDDFFHEEFDEEYEIEDEDSGSEADDEGLDHGDRGYFQLTDGTSHRTDTLNSSNNLGDDARSDNIILKLEERKENINIAAFKPILEEFSSSFNRKRKCTSNDEKVSPAIIRRRPLTLRI